MTPVTENVFQRRRGSRSQLSFQSDAEHDVLAGSIIDESLHNSRFGKWKSRIFCLLLGLTVIMHRSTKTALIAISILVCVIIVILLLNLESIKSSREDACVKIDEEEACHTTDSKPYRFYGTKTAYHIATGGSDTLKAFDVGACIPKVFYLLCRHATRYPDKDNIKDMIKLLPQLKNKISNNSHISGVKMCEEDLKNLKAWVEKLKPEFDNKMSVTGERETVELAKRYKTRLPSLLGRNYSPDKFKFEFTSRERTRSTAESFAKGLFNDDFKKINFENSTNDYVLQFHKDCKTLQKQCDNDPTYDTSEIDKFENSTLMLKVIDSVSARIGVPLTYDQIKVILKACVFGYALDIGDTWCSLFTNDELKVLEYGDDIDDYYKDAYGNKINYEQACPAVEFVVDMFKSYKNTSQSKAVMHFSHAGGVKKVFSIFGLYKDEEPLKADDFCSQQDRKWRSSLIAPFLSNIAFVMYDCGNENKIVAFHNEKPVKLGGCSDILCSYEEFSKMYNPIAEECNINSICCTCSTCRI